MLDGKPFRAAINTGTGTSSTMAFPSANGGSIGPVAAGWLPGDPINCVPSGLGLSGTACSGTRGDSKGHGPGGGGNAKGDFVSNGKPLDTGGERVLDRVGAGKCR